jgi:hypothetical protein
MADRRQDSSNGRSDRRGAAAEAEGMQSDGVAEEAAEVAATVAELQAGAVAEATARRRLRPLETLMLVMLAVSLLIHALTISQLFRVRNTLRGQIDQLAASVDAAKSDTVRYDLPIDQQIPINMDVPIKRSLTVPINTEVRIKQDINLPLDTGVAGTITIPIPIDATVPVSTTVPITFDQNINISTTVPLRLNVPIQIKLGSPQLSSYLDRLHDALLDLRDQL